MPIISLDILATSSVRGSNEHTSSFSVPQPRRTAPGADTNYGLALEPSQHPPQRSHSVGCCGSCFQKPKPFSSSHPHSSHPVRTTSTSHAQAAAAPSAAKASPHTWPVPLLVQPRSLTASALLPLAASCSSHTQPCTPCSRQGPHCILGSEGLGFNSSSSGRSSLETQIRLGTYYMLSSPGLSLQSPVTVVIIGSFCVVFVFFFHLTCFPDEIS